MRDNITTSDDNQKVRWTGRATELLTAIKDHLEGKVNHLSAGWILEKLHDDAGVVSEEWKHNLRNILKNYPGFPEGSSGVYSYIFLSQLEYVCENCRIYADDYKNVLE